MRGRLIFAAILTALTTIGSAVHAYAEDWCGYGAKDKSLIECGYSSASECQTAVGQGGMCFVDPDYALSVKRASPARPMTPAISPRLESARG